VSVDAPPDLAALLRAARADGPKLSEQVAVGRRLGLGPRGLVRLARPASLLALGALLGAGGIAGHMLLEARAARSGERLAQDGPAASASAAEHAALVGEGSGDAARSALPRSPLPSDSAGTRAEPLVASDAATPGEVLARGAPAPRAERSAGAAAPRTQPAPPSEASLLSAARRALPGDPALALRWVARHRELYPAGLLSEERRVLEIEALALAGRRDEAELRADEFRAAHPGSPHQPTTD
jgi:hypothetical protein